MPHAHVRACCLGAGGMRTLVLKDWTIAPGLAYDSAQPSHPLRYTLALRKNPQVCGRLPRSPYMHHTHIEHTYPPSTPSLHNVSPIPAHSRACVGLASKV